MAIIRPFEDPKFICHYEEKNHWIYAEWIGEQPLETIIKHCNIMIAGVKKYQCTKVLNDNRQVFGNWQDSIEWLESDWIPGLFNAGCRYFAWVQSECFHSQASVQETLSLDFRSIIVLIFDDLESAKSWLREI